jgi:hypothetical protein
MNAQIYSFDPACQTECDEKENFSAIAGIEEKKRKQNTGDWTSEQ